MLKISQLFIYPIKSLGGISLQKAEVTDRGFKHDRRWMLVDSNNRFLTQREFGVMALLKVSLTDDGLLVTFSVDGSSILIPFRPSTNKTTEVVVWDDTCIGQLVSNEADMWFTKKLNMNCRLIFMPDDSHRGTDPRYTQDGQITSFSDGYPFMMISQESLDDLNGKMEKPLGIERFRPNIVFTGGHAFEEDLINEFSINNIHFNGVKLCARCVMTTIDQQTAEKGKDPLKTLATYRSKNKKIYFGQNVVHTGTGLITIGDELNVLSTHIDERFIITQKS